MNARNSAALRRAIFLKTLKNCGVRALVISPNCAESAAFARAGAKIFGAKNVVPATDAHAAAFFALGLAKSTFRPVVLAFSAGTAGVSPALAEAQISGTPLIAVGVGNENGAGTPKTFAETREAAISAFAQSAENSVPVRVDLCAENSVAGTGQSPESEKSDEAPGDFDLENFCAVPRAPLRDFFRKIASADAFPQFAALAGKKILILAGATPAGRDDTFFADALSRKICAPILADATHPLRRFPPARERVVERFDAIFKAAAKPYAEDFSALRPDAIFRIGELPENEFLRAKIASLRETPIFVFNACADETAVPAGTNVVRIRARFRDVFGSVFQDFASKNPFPQTRAAAQFLESWMLADARFKAKSEAFFRNAAAGTFALRGEKNAAGTPTEPQIARFLCENVFEAETAIFVAAGNPLRDMNVYCPSGTRFWLFANRGANAADGTLASALGVAHGCMEQTILYTDDLALLRDANAFLLAPHFCGNLTIVLQNSGGGNALRTAAGTASACARDTDFAQLAGAFGADFARAGTLAELKNALRNFRSHQGIHVVEIRTDAEISRKIRAELSR